MDVDAETAGDGLVLEARGEQREQLPFAVVESTGLMRPDRYAALPHRLEQGHQRVPQQRVAHHQGRRRGVGDTGAAGDRTTWLVDRDVADGGLMSVEATPTAGGEVTVINAESGPDALRAYSLEATADAVTVGTYSTGTTWANENLTKIHQLAPDGSGSPARVSCNRGEQAFPVADTGKRVVWLDGTTGSTDLVTRDRPAGRC